MSYSFDPKSRVVHVRFRYPAGRRGVGRYVSLPANSEREALIAWAGIQETLDDLRRGKLDMPPSLNDAQVKDYIVSGGKVLPPAADAPGRFSIQTTGELLDFYDRELTAGAKGDGTRYTEQIHSRHLRRILKPDLPLAELDQKAVQDYVNRRAKEGVSPITIGKELSTLSTIQGWASVLGVVGAREWRRERLTFPKGKEKPPFQTLDQIERRIAKGNLSADDEETLWESLWLNTAQTLDVLDTVNQAEVEPVVYPLFVAAAYTGARRGELLRSEREDWDFEGERVAIRQSKADKSKIFTVRHVPIHPALARTLQEWFRSSCSHLAFTQLDGSPINPDRATRYFKKAVNGSRWSVLRGWHVFRHSLASNLASQGVDQRQIDAILGHSTEEMSRRYRHLLPAKQASAIASVFPS